MIYMGDLHLVPPELHAGCWHFENGAASKIDDVLTEHGGIILMMILGLISTHSDENT